MDTLKRKSTNEIKSKIQIAYVGTTDLLEISSWPDYFDNLDGINCPITRCDILSKDCKNEMDLNGYVHISETNQLMAAQNFPLGYSG